ncbi:MAG: NAD(P)H-binding protein [Sphingobium sp.]|nr:NAD(P)H-binding protein [Sphingobium sp.]
MTLLAITGATGFVGKAVLAKALADGLRVRALTRRPQEPRDGVEWILGTLEDQRQLEKLVAGTDTVLHIAGMVNAPNRAAFEACNATGTAAVIAAMKAQGIQRLVHVSSLAAREPQLSDYGWSKAEAERHVAGSGLDWTMIRPPAIYGPHDAEFLELFQMAQWGFMLLPPGGRISIIHADDLADLLVAMARTPDRATHDQIYEVDDGRHNAWTHKTLAKAIGRAVGRNVVPVNMPALLVKLGAHVDRLIRRDKARLTPDRASYFCHPDWSSRVAMAPPESVWTPQIDTEPGLAATAEAYRERGYLR